MEKINAVIILLVVIIVMQGMLMNQLNSVLKCLRGLSDDAHRSLDDLERLLGRIERHTLSTARAVVYQSSLFMQQARIEERVDKEYYDLWS